jgi:16S rRNA (cytidine1402-2'-O)-methyltransferase
MKNNIGKVFLIPCPLASNALHTILPYTVDAIKNCDAFFVEVEKTTRRFFKSIHKEMVIDNFEWHTIHFAETQVQQRFKEILLAGKNIGIVSEAGCPGIADPGQILVNVAQQIGATVVPIVGPSSIFLALMASGLNGQSFAFHGYLPIDSMERKSKIKQLELTSNQQKNSTQIFIETPYRNQALLQDLLQTCKGNTLLCIAANITSENESIITKSVSDWKKENLNFHKQPAIFLLQSV